MSNRACWAGLVELQKTQNFWIAEPMPQANHCFCYRSRLIITFSPLGLHLVFMPMLHSFHENHCFHYYSNAKWTSEFNDVLHFRSISKLSKNHKKHDLSIFHQFLHCFELLGSTEATVISFEMFKEIYRKRTCEKT